MVMDNPQAEIRLGSQPTTDLRYMYVSNGLLYPEFATALLVKVVVEEARKQSRVFSNLYHVHSMPWEQFQGSRPLLEASVNGTIPNRVF